MSDFSYSDDELNEYFSDAGARASNASSGASRASSDSLWGHVRYFFYDRFDDPRKGQAFTVLSTLVALGLITVLTLGLWTYTLLDDIPPTQSLENPDFQLATIAYTADGEQLARYARQNRSWANYEDISPHTVDALVATEDHRFHQHWGMDLFRTVSAVGQTALSQLGIPGFSVQGGSTISQQLARNLYDTTVGREVSVTRKLREMVTAVELERRYTKREIIEMYLNTVEFGNNAFGIEAAAHTFYGTTAEELDELQSATLIGMLKGISYYNPVRNPERAQQRRNVVLRQMERHGFITEEFLAEHRDTPVDATHHSAELQASLAPYFAEYVRNWMRDWAAENDYDVYGDGLRVYTTLNSELQDMAQAAVDSQMTALQAVVEYEWSRDIVPAPRSSNASDYLGFDDYEPFRYLWDERRDIVYDHIRQTDHYRSLQEQGYSDEEALRTLHNDPEFADSLKAAAFQLEAGLVSMDPRSGHVKAWVGGRDFERDKYDKVSIAQRQPGSTFKPFVYTTAIDNGYSPYETMVDSSFIWEDPYQDTTWTPTNFGETTNQEYTLSQGLANSVNTITARLGLQLGPGNVATYANHLGIESSMREVPALSLGASEVTLLEMTTAYNTLANGGLYSEPTVVTRIEDRHGNVLYEANPTRREALSEETAYTVVDMMRGVIDYGTGVGIRSQWNLDDYDLAGKTGTTQRSADGWFVLLHPELVTGSWVGFNDSRITFRSTAWGQGSRTALPIVGDYFSRAVDNPSFEIGNTQFPMASDFMMDPSDEDGGSPDEDRIGW